MYQVVKRDGSIAEFHIEKITKAVSLAFEALEKQYNPSTIDFLALKITANFEDKIKDGLISVEDIQDSVETVLSQAGYADVAKCYILYRKQREQLRNLKPTVLDYKELVNSYVNVTDWRVKENSTVTYSVGGLILSNSGAVTANYWLNEIYDEEIANAHKNADIHLHDLSMLTGYCAGWSLRQLIQEGLGGITGKITSSPAKHLATLCNQMVNFLGILQNEWAGAQAFSSFDTYLAPFVKADNLDYDTTKKCIESFVYGVNTPSRWGTQAPFSNITLDWTVPEDLAEQNCIVGGKEMPFKYKDCKKEMDMVNKAFIEIMIEGDANGRGFQYPIPTYSITRDFDWSETENNKLLFEMTAKYGTPYFSNYVNSDLKPSDIRSMAILGSQEVIYKDRFGRISKNQISSLVELWQKNKEKNHYKILMNGKFVDVTEMFKIDYSGYKNYYKVELSNGITQNFSYDHKCLVVRDGELKEVRVQDIVLGDRFALARHGYDVADNGTYESGYVLGACLADGWTTHNETQLALAINIKKTDVVERVSDYFRNLGARVTVEKREDVNIYTVNIYSKTAVGFFREYITGKKASKKRLTLKVYDTSLKFREGLYDGYYATDGSPKNKMFAHTTNKNLVQDLIKVSATIGRYFTYSINRKNTRYFKKDKSDFERFISYKLRVRDFEAFNDDYYVIDIKKVSAVNASRINYVYNFTVDTPEHLYELPNGIISPQCCRLRLDLRELRKKSGGFFGSGENTGSVGVVTINLPRIAYLAENEQDFYKRLDRMMDISARSLSIKRKVITKLLEEGLYPYTKRYLGTFSNHFSTIGLVGMNEVGLNAKWIRADMTSPKTQDFAKDVLKHMRERLSDYQELYGDLYNLEATPAESTSYRLAKHDKKRYPDIITASGETPYYTNSSHLPVGYTEDVFSALDIQDELQTLYTSGTVFHAFLGEKLPNWKSAADLVRKIAENYRLPYYTLSPTYSVCKNHGYIKGEEFKCPDCGQDTEVYSRITGYYRPVQNWNEGKTQEYKDRKEYVIGAFRSDEHVPGHNCLNEQKESENKNPIPLSDGLYLFKTATCPNCKIALAKLNKSNIAVNEILAFENEDLAVALGIRQAPTLVVIDGGEVSKFAGVSEIIKWIENR